MAAGAEPRGPDGGPRGAGLLGRDRAAAPHLVRVPPPARRGPGVPAPRGGAGGFARLQLPAGTGAAAPRRAGLLLHRPPGLGLAPGARRADGALGGAPRGHLPVRGGAVPGGRACARASSGTRCSRGSIPRWTRPRSARSSASRRARPCSGSCRGAARRSCARTRRSWPRPPAACARAAPASRWRWRSRPDWSARRAGWARRSTGCACVTGRTRAVQAHATCCAVASGTATLETALFGTPEAIVYRTGWLNYEIARRVVTLAHIGLPNIVAGEEVAPELLQRRPDRGAPRGHARALARRPGGARAAARAARHGARAPRRPGRGAAGRGVAVGDGGVSRGRERSWWFPLATLAGRGRAAAPRTHVDPAAHEHRRVRPPAGRGRALHLRPVALPDAAAHLRLPRARRGRARQPEPGRGADRRGHRAHRLRRRARLEQPRRPAGLQRAGALRREQGRSLTITPDGPRGPREVVKPGLVRLASLTGLPVLPVASASRRPWVLRSWDGFRVPRPFAVVWISYGEPVQVPPGLDEAGIEVWRRHARGGPAREYRAPRGRGGGGRVSLAWMAYRLAAPCLGAVLPAARIFVPPHERALLGRAPGPHAAAGRGGRLDPRRLDGRGHGAWAPSSASCRRVAPRARFLLTATTRSGRERLGALGQPAAVAPLDSPQAAAALLRAAWHPGAASCSRPSCGRTGCCGRGPRGCRSPW